MARQSPGAGRRSGIGVGLGFWAGDDHLTLQTQDLQVYYSVFTGIWGDFGGTPRRSLQGHFPRFPFTSRDPLQTGCYALKHGCRTVLHLRWDDRGTRPDRLVPVLFTWADHPRY